MPTAFLEEHPALNETGIINSSSGTIPVELCPRATIPFDHSQNIVPRTLVVCPDCGEEVLVERVIE